MIQSIPRMYATWFLGALIAGALVVWYLNTYQRDDITLQINDAIAANTISEYDQTTRMYPGALLLNETFEHAVYVRLSDFLSNGDTIQFDYRYDTKDARFTTVPGKSSSSRIFTIGGTAPNPTSIETYVRQPLLAVRVKVHKKADRVADWTYSGTMTLDSVPIP